MKRNTMILLVTLTLLALLVSAYSQGAIKREEVTAQTLTSQPAGKSYSMDLTRSGKIYNIAAGLDYSRIRFRTARGEMAMNDYVRKMGITSGSFLMGTESDLSAINFGATGGGVSLPTDKGSAVKCKNDLCICIAGTDCKDTVKAKLCIDGTWSCYKPTGKPMQCSCIAKTAIN